jgi:hypothetical protein
LAKTTRGISPESTDPEERRQGFEGAGREL